MTAFQLLHAAAGEAEAGHDLVEDEQGAVLCGDLADILKVAGVGLDEADIAAIGLDDDAGNLARVRGEGRVERRDVVIGEDDRLLRERGGDAGAVGVAVGERAGAGLDE